MSKFHSFIAFFLFPLGLMAQANVPNTLNGWVDHLQKFGKNIPQEQIFIHTDNTCYFLGDTLFYKAYVRRSDGIPSRVSKVLYVELLNQDGYLVQRQLLELNRGEAHGNFALSDTLYGGYYELRAYTRWQLNWGETEHPHTDFAEKWFFNKKMAKDYYRDYEKLYSKVFPVYDKPKAPGEFEHFMTLRPLRRHYKAEGEVPQAVVQFYPEGGHLVAGVNNRVAFEANDDDGMHIDGTLTVMDNDGNKVAEAKTEKRGRGSIEFIPVSGKKYTSQFTWNYKMGKQDLPKVETDGCAIMVKQQNGEVKVDLALSGTAATESLGMTVMNQGQLLHFQELGTGAQLSATLTPDKLQTGVCQVTVFNVEGRIYADRLFFVRKDDLKSQNITFSGFDDAPTQPFAPISLQVSGTVPNSHISIAVRDAAHTEYVFDSGNILTEMLLSSQIRGFVEQPEYFFEKDDAEHQRALDLLLMIQGWRRYDWHTMAAPGAFVLNHLPEQTPVMMGDVNKYQAQNAEDLFAQAAEEMANDADKKISDENGEDNSDDEDENEENSTDKADQNEKKTLHDGYGRFNKEENSTDKADQNEKETLHDGYGRFNKNEGSLKNEVLVHASFKKKTESGYDDVVGDVVTQKGRFKIQSPRFFEGCYMELAASDTTKWKDNKHVWYEGGTTKYGDINYPEFYVRLSQIYPRFVKPYGWYQEHLAEAPKGSAMEEDWINDGSRLLHEVTVGAKRNSLRKFDASKPAYVVDAYTALNEAIDAGLCPGYYIGQQRFATDVARAYIGDMNMNRQYDLIIRQNSKLDSETSAYKEERESTASRSKKGVQIETAPTWHSNISPLSKEDFNKFTNLYKVYIYTDYSPRREGDKHFEGSNQPEVTIDLRTFPDQSRRTIRRDRYYLLPGFSAPDDFYQPDYSNKPLPDTKDYRRTLYWNPNLELDASGSAKIQFYNNCRQTQIAISAEGMATDGTLLTGKSMPEDRK